jgi:outer membrane biosynthesis protein TonB
MTSPLESNEIKEKLKNHEVKTKFDKTKKEENTKVAEKPKEERKPKEKKAKEPKPKRHFINKYNFLHVSNDILKQLGWPTGENIDVTFEVKDGVLVIRKA